MKLHTRLLKLVSFIYQVEEREGIQQGLLGLVLNIRKTNYNMGRSSKSFNILLFATWVWAIKFVQQMVIHFLERDK